MSTAREILDLIAEAEKSRETRRVAWTNLQRLRALLRDRCGVLVPRPKPRSFALEGQIIEKTLADYVTASRGAFTELYEAAVSFQKAAFNERSEEFPLAHQRLMNALETSRDFINEQRP